LTVSFVRRDRARSVTGAVPETVKLNKQLAQVGDAAAHVAQHPSRSAPPSNDAQRPRCDRQS